MIDMLSKIVHKVIPTESKYTNIVNSFDCKKIELTNDLITVFDGKNKFFESSLEYHSKDFYSATYFGTFPDGEKFRLLIPSEIVINQIKKEYNCESYFSIASLDPDGYAVNFIVVNNSDNRTIEATETDSIDKIQTMVNKSVEAFSLNSHKNFLDFTSRILKLLESGDDIRRYKNGEIVLKIMQLNINLYEESLKKKLYSVN